MVLAATLFKPINTQFPRTQFRLGKAGSTDQCLKIPFAVAVKTQTSGPAGK